MDQSRIVNFDLYRKASSNYYGAVVEGSRGCPFLCEFCDIRVMPGNNRANNKDPKLIVGKMDEYYKIGVRQFQFACDNFIGDITWARQCVEAIIGWKEKANEKIPIFVLTITNLPVEYLIHSSVNC